MRSYCPGMLNRETSGMNGQQKLYFEDYAVGTKDSFGRYEVTRGEVIDFARKYDPQPFHLSDEAAAKSLFGRLCASGWHSCAMTMRMMVDHMAEIGAQSLGSPGIDELRWLHPVYPGDVLRVETEVVEARRMRSRPDIGILRSVWRVLNQDDKEVMTFTGNAMFRCRSAGTEV
ncbi:MAG: MaoC family dehydratase [Rhodothalassiaceae bacterium]